jgi:hypothetical protein
MKVISELNARIMLPIPAEEVYPMEGVHLPDVINDIAVLYKFTSWPDLQRVSPKEIEQEGIQFRMGKFVLATGQEALIKDFTVHDWGLVVSAHNTGVAEEFIGDVIRVLAEGYNFRADPIARAKTLALSELLVEFADVFDKALRNFEVISHSLEKEFLNHYDVEKKFKVNGLGLDFQRLFVPPPISNLSQFVVERRINTSFDENKYYCKAPFRTGDHIRLLDEIEKLFSA